ncbi:metal ABC transporter ATP-binding protein [Flexivirga caeni]|uniref:Metal ABC transporter ATP-binding protein n=1 Tax=Flexivirga caeni TaxID=2294115 RepID=A0A3M9MEJ9_9MICO|nr:metal ABC transporter ATP-binding protein [Flexivirga caeni]
MRSSEDAPGTYGEGAPPTGADLLRLDDVNVRFGDRQVLRDVAFAIEPGQFVGLIGSNGAGKTTLLRVILGLQRPTSGAVHLAAGHELGGAGRPRRAPLVGYVPQKVMLDPDLPLRARDVVALGIDGRRPGIGLPSRSRLALVDRLLEQVSATRFADSRVGELSGGEQQRVLIAHALIGRPRLLLLDEPLANLDLNAGQDVVNLLARLAHEQQIAILLSAHEMNPLLPVMDRVVYLAGGRAVSGRTDEVIRTDVLSGLYGRPVEVLEVQGRVLVVAGLETPDLPVVSAGARATR